MDEIKEEKKSKSIMVAIIGILALIIVTVGVTYAVFTYARLGTTENTITAGTIQFVYTENTGVGSGIELTNALPIADSVGKSYTTDGKVFDFKITANNSGGELIPYEVTLRNSDESTLDGSIVKVYLTDMTDEADTEIVAPTKYTLLPDTKIDTGKYTEKTLYTGSVGNGVANYDKSFRLRMWIDEEADFSATGVDSEGNPIYPYNNKTFKALVNVYANAEVVSTEQ